ncbi:zinc-binding dehydrogenase [Luteimonas composti]|uniref:enoyl-[acyl-carrier-protein] reductase n=1 Tax=Luteimonas composti TaxID=398257 RepID=A0ABT6MUP3_9GAMM|nr:zinc-binding dehydrogenase [Luteimonas composti]MDH7454357.1 zinc-binding dehydrogenase [Luteimonas composti]
MRSAIHERFGEPAEVLAPGESAVPEPGRGEVRVRMRLAPIHNHDLFTVRGQYGWKPTLPAIGGSEGCGVIDAVGEGVEGFAPGQRVTAASGRGTWAEYFVADARMLVPVPDAMPDELAAQLVAMPLSALMLLDTLAVEPGQWIVQNAANGAVGKTLAMLAAARGVRVLSLVRREQGVAELAALGVEDVLCTQAEGWRDEARQRLGKEAARAAVDSVGGSASADLCALLGNGGVLVSFGAMGGEPMHVPPGDVIFRDVQVRGFWGSRTSREMAAERKRALFAELIQRALDGQLRLPVDAIYDLEQVAEAAAASLRPGRGGKVLLRG